MSEITDDSEMDSRAEPDHADTDYDDSVYNESVYDRAPDDTEGYDLETPEADAAEQRRATGDETFLWSAEQEEAAHVPAEVDPADHADQVRSVDGDEDDYR